MTKALKPLSVEYPSANHVTVSSLAYTCSLEFRGVGSASVLGCTSWVLESASTLLPFGGCTRVVLVSMAHSRSLMKDCHARCSSLCSVDSEGSGRSFLAGEMKLGILGSLDKGSTLEWARPGLWMMAISRKAEKTRPHVASLLFAFSYVFAQVKAEWSAARSTLSPSMKGWKCTRLSLAARASLSVAEYLVSAGASTRLQYATTHFTGI